MSKPERARAILLGTTAIVSAVLAIWLFCWVLFIRPAAVAAGWASLRGAAAPVLAFQAEDARAFGRPLERGVEPGSPVQDVGRVLGDLVKLGGREPLVAYLSVPGIGVDERPYLLAGDEAPFVTGQVGEDALGSVDDFLDTLARDRGRDKLLILDAGQVTTDRDLGIFANSFLHRLDERLRAEPVPNLAVLSACAPGQESHVSEPDRRSVFAHYVALGLAGAAEGWDAEQRGVSVHGLARYVREHVARWAMDHRRAVQTPVLLGVRSVNFELERIGRPEPVAPSKEQHERLDAIQARLIESWQARDRLEAREPYRHAPLLWRRYLDELLRAERLFRAARAADCEAALAQAGELATRLDARADGLPLDRAWSLALGEANAATLPPAARDDLDEAAAAIEQALDQLTGRDEFEAAIAEAARAPVEGGAGMIEANAEAPDDAAPPPGPEEAPEDRAGDRGADPENALTQRVDGQEFPRYNEAQLAVWARTYLDAGLGTRFDGRRARVLLDAQRVLELAERLAAVDGRVARRVEPLLALADARRRLAQDCLFAPEGPAILDAEAALHEAEALYNATLEYAATLAGAEDLLQQLLAELPDLGAWKSRRATGGLDSPFVALLDDAEALAARLADDDGPPGATEDLDAARQRVEADDRALGELLRKVENGFTTLRRDFWNECRIAARSSARLDELDDLLRVPLIPADVRAALLRNVRTAEVAGPLSSQPQAPADPSSAMAVDDPEPDPRFWPHALGLARVECTLLALGGADAGEVAALRQDLEEARGATRHPDKAFSALDDFSRRLRRLRRALADRAVDAASRPLLALDDAEIEALLSAADRAARALPRAHLVTLAESSAPDLLLSRFHRHETLRRIGRRLVEDYAPEHALLVFDDAGKSLASSGLDADVARAREVGRSRLSLATAPPGPLRMEGSEAPLTVSVQATGVVPEGLALVAFASEEDLPLTIRPTDQPTDAHRAPGSVLVPIGGTAGAGELGYLLERAAYSAELIRCLLEPGVFYRGRLASRPQPLAVTLDRAREEVEVVLKDRDDRDFGDQFADHPTRGYLHYGATLRYQLVLTNTTDRLRDVWVSRALDGQAPETTRLQIPPGGAVDTIGGEVRAVDLGPPLPVAAGPGEAGTPEPITNLREPGPNEVPLGVPRTLTVEVREGGPEGRLLSIPRKYEFHQLDVAEYAAVQAQFDPIRRRLYVIVYHKRSDPVRGPFYVSAFLGAEAINQNGRVARGGRPAVFYSQPVPPGVEKVGWSVNIGHKTQAFSGETPTNIQPPQAPPAPPPSPGAPNL